MATSFFPSTAFNVTFPVVSAELPTWRSHFGNPKCSSVYYTFVRMALWALNCCSKGSTRLDIPTPNTVRAAEYCVGWIVKNSKMAQRSPGRYSSPLPSTLVALFFPLFRPLSFFLCFSSHALMLKDPSNIDQMATCARHMPMTVTSLLWGGDHCPSGKMAELGLWELGTFVWFPAARRQQNWNSESESRVSANSMA